LGDATEGVFTDAGGTGDGAEVGVGFFSARNISVNSPGLLEGALGVADAGGTIGADGCVCDDEEGAGFGCSGIGVCLPCDPIRDFKRSSSCGGADFEEAVPKMAVALDASLVPESLLSGASGSSKGDLDVSIQGYRISQLSRDSGDQDYMVNYLTVKSGQPTMHTRLGRSKFRLWNLDGQTRRLAVMTPHARVPLNKQLRRMVRSL